MKTYLSLLLAALLLVPPSLSAGPTVDPQNYKPSPFANDSLSLIGGEMMEDLSFGLGIFFDYQRDPLVLTDTTSDTVLRKMIGNHLTADLTLSLGLFEWVDLGIAIPAVMYQDGDGWGDDDLPAGTLGDLRFAMRVRLYRTEDELFSLALVPLLTFPTGRPLHDLSGSDGITFSPMLAMSINSKWVDAGLDLYYRMTQSDIPIGGTRLADQVGLKALVSAYAIPDTLSFNAEFSAATTAGATFAEPDESPMEATLSGTWRHAPADIALTVGGGAGIVHGFATPQFRVFAGLSWTLKQEPKEPSSVAEAPVADKAPVPQEKPAPASMTGEPESAAPPRPKAVDLDLSPKPAPQAKVITLQEKPKEAAPASAPAVAPAPKPVAPAPAPTVAPAVAPAPKPAAPAPAPKKVEPRTGTPWAETIHFKENSTEFTDDSRVKLEKLNLLLSQNFTLKIRIEAHCDRNEKPDLALKRAQAVKLWFVDRDIESKRIQTRGFGADEPVASSDLESDRARNRRATFFMLSE